jgi:hypothetical protein
MLDPLRPDVRFGVRTVLKNPWFALAAVATLALGIGATTAVFTVVDAVLLRPAPFRDMDRLAVVWETDRHAGTTREPSSIPDFFDDLGRRAKTQTERRHRRGDAVDSGRGDRRPDERRPSRSADASPGSSRPGPFRRSWWPSCSPGAILASPRTWAEWE